MLMTIFPVLNAIDLIYVDASPAPQLSFYVGGGIFISRCLAGEVIELEFRPQGTRERWDSLLWAVAFIT